MSSSGCCKLSVLYLWRENPSGKCVRASQIPSTVNLEIALFYYMMSISRRRFLAAASLTALVGCSEPDIAGKGAQKERREITGTETVQESSKVPTADRRLPLPMSPDQLRSKARSGGPPKDGIPSIDEPEFVAAGDADYLDLGDPVFGIVRDGVAKAYPQKILVLHEIANDDFAGTAVSITYCPLTGTVLGFERGNTTFGVSGRLINNNLVMYDRAMEAWWPQILATSIPGPWNEEPEINSLREIRLIWTTWQRWQKQHPDTQVLSTDTGYAKNYNHDPYGSYNPRRGYYVDDNLLFPALSSDNRYDKKTVVMGARTAEGVVAFLKDAIRKNHLMTGEISDTSVLAVYDPRYDTAYVYLNPDKATFKFDNGTVVAADGTSYLPDELPLSRIHTFDAMWFAWAGFYPNTNVYD